MGEAVSLEYRRLALANLDNRAGWALIVAVALLGCIAGESRGYPLYATSAGPMDPSRVARLAGYVRFVDGLDVSEHGTTFDLLPGCHLIGTPSRWGSASMSGGVAVSTGTLTFALPMKAGHQYAVAVEASLAGGGPSHPAFVRAYERDPSGATKETFAPVSSESDVQRCRDLAGPASESEPPAISPRVVASDRPADESAADEARETRAEPLGPSSTPCVPHAASAPGETTSAPAVRASAVAAWAHYRILAAGGPFCKVEKQEVLGCLPSKRSCGGDCESLCAIACFVSRDDADNASVHCFTTMDSCKAHWDGLAGAGRIGQYACETVSTSRQPP